MRPDKSGNCVIWEKGKGFLDYTKSKNPKPSAKDGGKDIKSMVELMFGIEDCDWTNEAPEKPIQKVGKEPATKAGTKKPAAGTKKPVAGTKKPAAAGTAGKKPVAKKPAAAAEGKKPVKKTVKKKAAA
jgi:hypothetical protein